MARWRARAARFAARRNQVNQPAARGEMAALAVDAGDVHRDRVEAPEIVEQPATSTPSAANACWIPRRSKRAGRPAELVLIRDKA